MPPNKLVDLSFEKTSFLCSFIKQKLYYYLIGYKKLNDEDEYILNEIYRPRVADGYHGAYKDMLFESDVGMFY